MKKLHKFIIKSYLGPFVLTFFISLFVLLMQFLWKYIDDLVGKGLEWYVIAELLLYTSASLVPLALPLAVLLSSIMTFGNLGEYYELVALKSSGLSLQKIMLPLIVISVLICIAAFFFSNNILPIANLKMGTLLWDVRQQKPALNIKKGIFYNGIDGYSIKIEKKDKSGRKLEDIMIYDHTGMKGNNKVITAQTGKMEMSEDERYLILSLYKGNSYDEVNAYEKKAGNTMPLRRMKFNEQIIRFDLSTFKLSRTSEDLFKDHQQMLNMKQLQVAEDSLNKEIEKRKLDIASRISGRYFFGKYKLATTDSSEKKELENTVILGTDTIDMPVAGIEDTNPHVSEPDAYMKKQKALTDTDTGHAIYDIQTAIFNGLTQSKRVKIIETATQQARNTKMYVSVSKNDLDRKRKLIIKHKVEWHRKLTLSFACILLFFIGAPLGAIIRKGGLGMPLVVSIMFFLLYHVLSIIGEKFVKEAVLLPYQGMWLASSVFLPIGVFLTHKATTDSALFDINKYTFFFKRLFERRT